MRAVLLLLAVVMLAGYASASYVTVLEPINATLYQGGSVLLGKDGPGQTFYITISAATKNSTGALFENGWNQLVATGVPQGWIVQNSSLNDQQLSVKIDPSPNAQTGMYTFNLTAINTANYSHLGALAFTAIIDITPDVFVLQVAPTNVSTGPGQPASIFVTINNTGVSDSPFIITMQGLPAWNTTKPVIALHHTSETFTYPVYEYEPGVYHAVLNVTSGSSPLVYKRSGVNLTVQETLINDFKAVGQGAIGFPIIYQPVYALMYIISKLLGLIGINS